MIILVEAHTVNRWGCRRGIHSQRLQEVTRWLSNGCVASRCINSVAGCPHLRSVTVESLEW